MRIKNLIYETSTFFFRLIMKNFVFLSLLGLAACASNRKVDFPAPVDRPGFESDRQEPLRIDYEGLQNFLNLDRSVERLGYVEKAFPTCEVGYGYPSNRNCRTDYFVLIHFQLLCRDTNQESYTKVLDASDMSPLKGRRVKWTLKNMKGTLNLDDKGFGQIKTTARRSPKVQRLKLNIANDNLYVKAGEINRIVTPANWCN